MIPRTSSGEEGDSRESLRVAWAALPPAVREAMELALARSLLASLEELAASAPPAPTEREADRATE